MYPRTTQPSRSAALSAGSKQNTSGMLCPASLASYHSTHTGAYRVINAEESGSDAKQKREKKGEKVALNPETMELP